MLNRLPKWTSVTFIISLLFFSGCHGSMPFPSKTPAAAEKELMQAIVTFMDAMVEKNWKTAYLFFDSEFRRGVNDSTFINYPRKIEVKSYEIKSVELKPSLKEAVVVVLKDISQQGFTFKGIENRQLWIMEKGGWRILEPPPAPPSQ